MKIDKASRTAQYMALFRALETNRNSNERLFTDPYAISFLDKGLKLAVKASKLSILRNFITKKFKREYQVPFHQELPERNILTTCYKKQLQLVLNR